MNVPNTRGYIQSRQALVLLLVVMTCSMLGLLLVTTYAQDPTVQSAQTSSAGESGGSPCSGGAGGSSSLCVTKDCVRKFCNSVTQGALNVDSVSLSSDTILLGTSQVSANFMNGTSSASIQNAEVNINVTCTTTTYGDSDGDGDLEVVDTLVDPKEDSDFVVPVNATYTWTFTGGNDLITGNGTSATIDTSTLTAGTYVVTCRADLSLDDSVTFAGKDVPCAQLVQATYIESATLTIVDVTVTFQDPEGVALPSPLIIPTGDSASIQALIDPESATSEVSFVSDAPGIATVSVGSTSGDTIGLSITGVAEGSTTITAKVGGQEVATLSVSVEDIVWELTYWSVGDGGGGAGTNSAMSMSNVTLNEAGGGGGEGANLITEGATITVPADDPTAFQYEGKGNWFQNWFASCTITWPEGFTVVDDGDDNDETSTATRAFSAGSHSITVTASWSFLKVLPAGTKSTSATVNAISVSMLSCEGVDSTESSPQTVTIPLNHNNGSVDITATLSGTAPSGKPEWSGATSSSGLTATLDTTSAGVYAVSAECGNTVAINVEVVEVSKLSCEGVDSTESSPQTVTIPVNYNNGSVDIAATLSGTAPSGKPVWSGATSSNGLAATLDTNAAGVYAVSAECGNTVAINVEVVGVSIGAIDLVGKGGTADVAVTLTPSTVGGSIILELSTTEGTGNATFDGGSSTKTITQTETVTIHGVTESSAVDNIKLTAKVGETELATETFSVFTVALQRNHSFSQNNDLPNSAPIQALYGGVPVIGGPQELTKQGTVYMSYVVELEANIMPAGLGLDLSDFGATQVYDLAMTSKFDGRPNNVDTDNNVNDGAYVDAEMDRDGEGGGNAYFLIDGPGPGKQAFEQFFTQISDLRSISLSYSFTTQATYNGQACGEPLGWEVTITASRVIASVVWQ